MYPISENRNRLWHFTCAVRSHRGTLCGKLSRFYTRVYKNSNTHTDAQQYTHMHAKEKVLLAATTVTVPASVNCFIHSADGNSLASSSVTLTQQEKSSEKYKAGDIEGRGVKHRTKTRQRYREKLKAVAEAIKCRGVHTWLPSLSTPFHLLSCLV